MNEVIRFPGAEGQELVGRLTRTPGPPRAYALFAHCFTCGKDLRGAHRIAGALAGEGIATLRFDFTGLGESAGDFADTNFSSNVQDLLAAVDWLRREHAAPALLVGHSLGGAAVLAAARAIPEATAVATIGAPADPAHVRRLFDPAAEELERTGEAQVLLGGRSFRIKRQLLRDLEAQDLPQGLDRLGKALLVLHAPADAVVPVDEARRLFQAARHPKSFVSLDGADHLLSRPEDAEWTARVIAAWAARYLPLAAAPPPLTSEPGLVVVRGGAAGYAQEISAGGHALRADEPQSVGGTDTGPGPYELLLAALGACTSMTLRMYADRKGWPLEGVTVELRHQKVHAQDCADCETREGKVDEVQRGIALEGALDAQQRARLLEIADRCPVHRTLESEIRVRTRLLGG